MRAVVVGVALLLASCGGPPPDSGGGNSRELPSVDTTTEAAPQRNESTEIGSAEPAANRFPKDIHVPSDAKASYQLLSVEMKGARRYSVTKRVGSSGTSFSKREIDCAAMTFRYVAEGDSLDEMASSESSYNKGSMATLVDGSISDVIVKAACAQG